MVRDHGDARDGADLEPAARGGRRARGARAARATLLVPEPPTLDRCARAAASSARNFALAAAAAEAFLEPRRSTPGGGAPRPPRRACRAGMDVVGEIR